MKNKLESWEIGLADRLKAHEFAFNPAARAGFETLLAAETAVAGKSVVGQPATAEQPVTPVANRPSQLFGKVLALLGIVALLGGLLLYVGARGKEGAAAGSVPVPPAVESPSATAPSATAPSERQTVPAGMDKANAPAPITYTAPAAPPRSPSERVTSVLPTPRTLAVTNRIGPRPLPTEGYISRPDRTRRRPPVAPIRVQLPVTVIPVPQRALPSVTVTPAARNRKP